jgi:hypothetical protein
LRLGPKYGRAIFDSLLVIKHTKSAPSKTLCNSLPPQRRIHLKPLSISLGWEMDDDEVESSLNINVTADVQGKSVSIVFNRRASLDDVIRSIRFDHQIPPQEQCYHVIRKKLKQILLLLLLFCFVLFCFVVVKVLISCCCYCLLLCFCVVKI